MKKKNNTLKNNLNSDSKEVFEKGFEEGFKSFLNICADNAVINNSKQYLERMARLQFEHIDKMNSMYAHNGANTLHGNAFEAYHEFSFNMDALSKETGEWVSQLSENGYASIDLQGNWGDNVSAKCCRNFRVSAMEQAHTPEQDYQSLISNLRRKGVDELKFPSREEFLSSRGAEGMDMSRSKYYGQYRLVPGDQMDECKKYLWGREIKEMHNEDNPRRISQGENFEDTADHLIDRIKSPKGASSKPKSYEEMRDMTRDIKNGEYDVEKEGVSVKQSADKKVVCDKIIDAALMTAIITAAIKSMPDIMEVIKNAKNNGYIQEEDLVRLKDDASFGFAEGLIRGAVTASIMSSAQMGYLTESIQKVSSSLQFSNGVVLVVIAVCETAKESIKFYNGEVSKQEYIYNVQKKLTTMMCGYTGGCLMLWLIPATPNLSFFIGSLIGSCIGNVVFDVSEKVFLGLCVENGFTFWGIVDQNYELPEEVKKKLGYDTFEYDKFEYDKFVYDTFEYDRLEYTPFEYEKFDICILKRGMIGLRKVGYVSH